MEPDQLIDKFIEKKGDLDKLVNDMIKQGENPK